MNQTTSLPILQIGATNDEVRILQEKLKILGFYAGSITGSFGKSTKLAVLDFQRKNALNETGVVDHVTWELLYKSTSVDKIDARQSQPTIKLGSSGEYVTILQKQLKQILYYNGSVNGIFDNETESSVKIFQSNNRLTTDGIVGRDTWSALTYLYAPLAICAVKEDIYVVKAGDTLYSIARNYNMTINELKQINHLTSDLLAIGQKLIVSSSNVSPSPEPDITYYTVKYGDTLYSIARNYNITVSEIKRINNLTSDFLAIGQKLIVSSNNVIPSPESNIIYYTVKSGDNLYSIARKYNVTVSEIKRINNLTSNLLSIGKTLMIYIN